jgi:tetratricopeptide (TPR) repeat protein
MAGLHRTLTLSARLALVPLAVILGAHSVEAGGMHGGHGGHPGHNQGGWIDPSSGFHGAHLGGGGPSNVINYAPGIFYGYGAAGPYLYSPPLTVVGAGGFAPALGPVFPQNFAPMGMGMGMGNGGLNLPMPPRGVVDPAAPRAQVQRSNPAKAKELVEIGDRSFRGRNLKRAEDKYKLAAKADPTSPAPHVHLAQVSLQRGDYSAAADHLRDAVTVSPDGAWLVNAPDIQAIYAEPGDFAKQLARLESHLQASPNDRDGWFVLGAETYLSGRSRQAFDVFQRLTDRRADDALTTFLDASKPRPAEANTN